MSRLYPIGLAVAGAVAAAALLLPFRAVPFDRGDGTTVLVPNPARLNHTSDTWDYLQEGRELYRGNGFTSLFTYPPHLPDSMVPHTTNAFHYRHPHDTSCFPVLWRQPLYPMMIAGAFAVAGGPNPNALLWLQALGIVLLPLAAYFLGCRLLSPGWAALAALWTLLSPVLLAARAPLVATAWFAALVAFVAGMLLFVKRGRGWVLLGLLVGLAALFRMDAWILLPGLLVMFWMSRVGGRRFGAAVVVVLVAGAVFSPALVFLVRDGFHNTLSLVYHNTDTFPGWTSSRTLAVRDLSAWGFLREHPGEVLAKGGVNLLRYLRDLVVLPSPLLAPLLWFAVLRRGKTGRERAFLAGGVVAVVTLLVVLSPMEYAARFLAPLVPLMTVGGTLGLVALPRFQRLLAGTATVIGLVMVTLSLTGRPADGTALAAAEDLRTLMTADPDLASNVDPLHEGGGVILSDAPTVYAWIWDACGVVWMPVASDLPELLAMFPRSVALFTRVAGSAGDALEPDLLQRYLAAGGVASGAAGAGQKPLAITWPEPE